MTVSEMAKQLKIPSATVKKRLLRAGCKPFSQEALYTNEDFEKIRNVAPVGRPRKAEPDPAESASKAKK